MSVVEGSCFLRQNSFLAIDRTAILPRACMSNPLRHCVEVCIRQYTPRERREKGRKTFTQPSPVLHNPMWHMTPHWDGFKTPPLQMCMYARCMYCGTCLQLVESSYIFAFLAVSSAFDVSCHLCVQKNWLTNWQADRQTNSMEQSPSEATSWGNQLHSVQSERSSPCSQESPTCSYIEPDESSLRTVILFL
jgi:hypothetical protein